MRSTCRNIYSRLSYIHREPQSPLRLGLWKMNDRASKRCSPAISRLILSLAGSISSVQTNHRYPPPVEVVQQVSNNFVGIPFASQGSMDKVDAECSDGFLLQLGRVIQHTDVNQDLIGCLPVAVTYLESSESPLCESRSQGSCYQAVSPATFVVQRETGCLLTFQEGWGLFGNIRRRLSF